MSGLIQNSHTSLLPIYAKTIAPGGTAVVLISTTTNVGQLITVRDMDGFLSSPQSITVSTTPGVTMDGATAPKLLQQGFGYLTLRSTGPAAWTTVDTSAFADPAADYTIRGVSYSSFQVTDTVILTGSTTTTAGVSTNAGTFLAMRVGGQMNVSTAQVATAATTNRRFDVSGAAHTISSATLTGNLQIQGTLTAANSALGDSVSSLQGAAISGNFTTSTLTITGILSTAYSTTVAQTIAVGGLTTFGSARVTRILDVSTLRTGTLQTTTTATDQLFLSTVGSYRARTDIPITDPAYTSTTNPTIFTDIPQATPTLVASWLAASTFTVPQLNVSNVISSPGCSQILLGNAAITNADGSGTFSSIAAGSANLSNTPTGPMGSRLAVVGLQTATVSSALTQYEFLTTTITTPFTYTTLMNANRITTSTLNTGQIATDGDLFTFSTVFISSGLVTADLSSFVATTARIQNTNGRATTSSMFTSSLTTSSLTGVQTITASPPSTLTFSTTAVTISSAQVSTATAGTAVTSSFAGTAISLGSPLNYSTLGPTDPWISTTVSTGLVYDTQYDYIQGIGTPYQPLRIHATTDRTVNLYLRNVSSFSTTFFTANMSYRNDSSISGVAGLRIVNAGGTSTIINFSANPIVGFQKQTISNYPIDISTAPSTSTYWLAGPNTLVAPSTIAAFQPIVAGGSSPAFLAYNAAGDTVTWAAAPSPPFISTAYATAWNGSNLWLTGGEGTNHLAYSFNGSNWLSTNTGLFTSIRSLAWNGSLWVAGGTGSNTLAYSPDGFNWTGLGVSTFTSTNAVAWNGRLWLAGGAGTNSLAYSYDGITWGGLGRSTFTAQATGLAWGASTNVWVATGGPSSIQLAYSYNGIQWFPGNVSTFVGPTSFGYCVGWNGSQFVAGGDSNIAYSADGANWTKVGVSTIMSTVRATAWTGSQWIIGGSYTTHALATSPDAATWTGITASTLFTTARTVTSRQALPIDISNTDLLYAGQTTLSYSQVPSLWNTTTGSMSTINGIAVGRDAIVATGKGKATDPSGSFLVLIENNGRFYYSTDDGANWTYSGQTFSAAGAVGVAFNGSLWVAVTDFAGILYSSNGISWTSATLPGGSGTDFRKVAFGNGRWIAVGNATIRVLTSTDGINWSTLPGAANLMLAFGQEVSYLGGLWIISCGGVGNPNSVIYSYDGLTWARSATASSNYSNTAGAVAWNGSRYAIVGNGIFGVMLSDDGITWTGSSTAQAILNTYSVSPSTVATNGTVWVVGFYKPSMSFAAGIMYSLDNGATWTEVVAVSSLMGFVSQVIWNGYYFIAVGQTQVGSYNVLRSADGINWSGLTLITGYFLSAVACRVPRPILNGQTILTSVNRGQSWRITDQSAIFTEARAAAWNGYLWVAVGDANTNAIAYSLDGIVWTGVTGTTLANSFRVVAWDGASWYVYGSGTNTIATSPDGLNWTGQGAGLAPTECAAYNGSNLWVGGATGANTLMTSANGVVWTGQGNTTFNTIVRAVAWNGSKWVATGGNNNALATSVNGTTWTTAGAPVLNTASGIVWTGKQWVALGTSTIATAATQATSWSTFTVSSLSTNSKLASAAALPFGFADSNIMFAGSSNATNRFAISMNGTNWLPISSVTAAVNAVSWNGRFWTFGLGAAPAVQIMNSNFVLSTPTQTSFNLTTAKGIAWGSQLGLAVGVGTSSRHIAYTTDGGLTWSANRNNASPFFFFDTVANGVAFGSNLWVAVGQEGTLTQSRGIRYSANGINWSTPSTTAGRGILLGCAVAYHSSVWVVGGSTIAGTNDTLAVSANGVTWNYLSNTTFSVAARGIAWGSNKFVAVGEGTNTIAYSTDGSNWTGVGTSIFSTRGHSVAWNGKTFVALGEGTNTMATSPDGITWTGLGTTTFDGMAGGGGIAARSVLPTLEPTPTPTAVQIAPKTFNWSLSAMTELSQTSVQKPAAGSAAWNARAASAEAFTASAWLSFQPAQTTAEIMFGLSENPTATLSFTALNFAFYMTAGGNLRIYELGTQVAIIGAYSASDTLRITYDGTTVRYYQNSTLVRSVARAVGAGLYMSSSFFTPGGIIQAVDFHPLYTLTPTKPALSTTGYAVTQTTGTAVDQFGPFYLTLTSNLAPSLFNFYVTLNGTATSTNSFYADVFINETKYFSTTIIAPVYSTLSTYILSFSNATAVQISTPALLDVRFRATRATGDTYLYTNWTDTSGVQQRSSATVQNSYNPNGIEYLQFFHNTFGTGLQTSELDIYVGPTSTLSTYLNSNAGIDMFFGYMKWNTALNSVTIENRYNDTQTRSLTYSGALYNASDPRLKEDIAAADQSALYQTIATLPLKRYRFNEEFRNTYRPEDQTQLGVLTTDLGTLLPHAVAPGPAGFDTVDRAQIRFAHMAATQALMARVSTLRAHLKTLLSPQIE